MTETSKMIDTGFVCSKCTLPIFNEEGSCTTGYGVGIDGSKVCFACCALDDKQSMRDNGKITLYLVLPSLSRRYGAKDYATEGTLTNWPGTLSLPIKRVRLGKHNMARVRYDVWFTFEGAEWHGVQYGDNTQICHCKKVSHGT